MTKITLTLIFLSIGISWPVHGSSGVYQAPEEFLRELFHGDVPKPNSIWLLDQLQADVEKIMGHPYGAKRIRYWRQGSRTAWILEDIGKEELITMGFVIDGEKIETTKLLIFRESRGWEIRHPSFTGQFHGATLQPNLSLNKDIDGISGATMSVNASIRLARLALFLTEHANPIAPQSER